MFFPVMQGFVIGGSLVIAIGAQNVFVIRQGLMGRRLLLTALLCTFADIVLISLGVLGFGKFVTYYPMFVVVVKYLAVMFLLAYGLFSLRSFFSSRVLPSANVGKFLTTRETVWILLVLSFLNPHAYLDAVVLLGGIASQHPPGERIFFALGAMVASFVWFFSITYGAHFLAPFFRNPRTWRVMDGITALIMWGIAFVLMVKDV